jgi:hypothetical protein
MNSSVQVVASHQASTKQKPYVVLDLGQYAPFEWTKRVDWSSISTRMPSAQHLVSQPRTLKLKLDATFYSDERGHTVGSGTDADNNRMFPVYFMSSVLNNLTQTKHCAIEDSHAWLLNMIGQPGILATLKMLPPHVLDALRERVFTAALHVGNIGIARLCR